MGKVWWILAGVALLSAVLLVLFRDGAVTVVGDGVQDVAVDPALRSGVVGAVDAYLIRRRESLRHLPEVARLCRGRCGDGLTVLYELRPGGGHKVLVFGLGGFDGIAGLDAGNGLPADIAACVSDAIAVEAARLVGLSGASCLPDYRWHLVLPYGL